MTFVRTLVTIPVVLAFATAPGLASANASSHPAQPPANGKAYGRYCQAESKKHVKGEKGTPFSQCVTAMAKLAGGETDSARHACDGESKKHVKGERGTPFSRCVSAAAKLKADESDAESGSDDTSA